MHSIAQRLYDIMTSTTQMFVLLVQRHYIYMRISYNQDINDIRLCTHSVLYIHSVRAYYIVNIFDNDNNDCNNDV